MLSKPWGTLVWANGTQPSLIKSSTIYALWNAGLTLWLKPHVWIIFSTSMWSFTVKGIPSSLILKALVIFISAKKFNLVWDGFEHLRTNDPNFSFPLTDANYSKDI